MRSPQRYAWDYVSWYATKIFRNMPVHIEDEPLLTKELATCIIIYFRSSWPSLSEGDMRVTFRLYGQIVLNACIEHRTRSLSRVICCNSFQVQYQILQSAICNWTFSPIRTTQIYDFCTQIYTRYLYYPIVNAKRGFLLSNSFSRRSFPLNYCSRMCDKCSTSSIIILF
jgi:hypothetical protein